MDYSAKLNELYAALYEPKLLPHDLLDNLQLENYISVNFSNDRDITIANTKCYLPDGKLAEFVYSFKDSKLFRLERIFKEHPPLIMYDRETEIKNLRNELLSNKISQVS